MLIIAEQECQPFGVHSRNLESIWMTVSQIAVEEFKG